MESLLEAVKKKHETVKDFDSSSDTCKTTVLFEKDLLSSPWGT